MTPQGKHISISTIYFILIFAIIGGCEKQPSHPIDSTIEVSSLQSATLSLSTINTDTINVGPERKPDDLLPIRLRAYATPYPLSPEGAKTRFSLVLGETQRILASGDLRNDGIAPDAIASDGTFSGYVDFQIERSAVSLLQLELWSEDKNRNRGTSTILSITIIRSNQPPALSNLAAPDTVPIGNQNRTILLQVRASDPDGQSDIRRVIFNSFRPDGSPSLGNPFSMFDDGDTANSGDPVRGDGIFSLRVAPSPPTASQTYRFEFQAFDRSNAGSNIITHFITIVP